MYAVGNHCSRNKSTRNNEKKTDIMKKQRENFNNPD